MKKISTIFISLIVLITLSACDNNGDNLSDPFLLLLRDGQNFYRENVEFEWSGLLFRISVESLYSNIDEGNLIHHDNDPNFWSSTITRSLNSSSLYEIYENFGINLRYIGWHYTFWIDQDFNIISTYLPYFSLPGSNFHFVYDVEEETTAIIKQTTVLDSEQLMDRALSTLSFTIREFNSERFIDETIIHVSRNATRDLLCNFGAYLIIGGESVDCP